MTVKKDKTIHTSGRRKMAIARATLKQGTGKIRINNRLLDFYEPYLAKMKIEEPLLLAEDYAGQVDIDINLNGGGVMAGADASRLAIAKALVQFAGVKSGLRERFLKYDRNMLVADVRYKEVCKPNDSKARAKRQKSYR